MPETIMEKSTWLSEHPEEEAKYAGEFIAVAEGKIVAHGKVCGEVMDEARRQGYEPLIAYAYGDEVLVLSARPCAYHSMSFTPPGWARSGDPSSPRLFPARRRQASRASFWTPAPTSP